MASLSAGAAGGSAAGSRSVCCGGHWPLVGCPEAVWGHCSLGWSPDSMAAR